MKNKNTIIQETKEIQLLYEDVVKETQMIKELVDKLQSFKAKTDKLNSFYQNRWLEYRDVLLDCQDEYFSILGEDTIYETICEQDKEVKKLIKECSEYIQ